MLQLDAHIEARDFDVSVTVGSGETLAILGPNGAGKSTLLNVIAGLLRPERGSARLNELTLFDLAPGSRPTYLPPHARGVSMLAQQALLFPHLSALDNVAFGPRSAGAGRAAARSRAREWLSRVDALEFAARRPSALSGGQAQRIAVARALASDPKLLLLDEPMAALDVTVAPALRRMLGTVLEGRTAIIVTHDILDAYTLADSVIVMNHGRVVEQGPTRKVFEHPRTAFTAALLALNLLTGIRTPTGMRTDSGLELAASAPGAAVEAARGSALGAPAGAAFDAAPGAAATPSPQVGSRVAATIRPTAVEVAARPPAQAQPNVVERVVTDLERRGDLVRVGFDGLFADIPPAAVADLDLAPGVSVWIRLPPAELELYAL